MGCFKILNLYINATCVFTDLSTLENNIIKLAKDKPSFIMVENIDYLTKLTLCHHTTNYLAIYFEKLGKIQTSVTLSEREFKLFRIALRSLVDHLNKNKFTYRVEGVITKEWLDYINNNMLLKLTDFYTKHNMNLNKQLDSDSNCVTNNICKQHNINPDNIIQRAYLFRILHGDIK